MNSIVGKIFHITAIFILFFPVAQAGQICVGTCPIEQLPPGGTISPPLTVPIDLGSSVISGVTPTNNGWDYFYLIGNSLSPVNSFTLPYFTDEQVSLVNTPLGWNFETGNLDVFGLGQGAGYMRWSSIGTPLSIGSNLFGFSSPWAPGSTTFSYTLVDSTSFTGGNTTIPLSADAVSHGLIALPTSVPIPPSFAFFISTLIAYSLNLCNRGRKSAFKG